MKAVTKTAAFILVAITLTMLVWTPRLRGQSEAAFAAEGLTTARWRA